MVKIGMAFKLLGFVGIGEELCNPNFNSNEFATVKSQDGKMANEPLMDANTRG